MLALGWLLQVLLLRWQLTEISSGAVNRLDTHRRRPAGARSRGKLGGLGDGHEDGEGPPGGENGNGTFGEGEIEAGDGNEVDFVRE